MYCKKCGRKLRNEARFCDHCGQSTKETRTQSTSKTTGARTQGSSKARSEYEKNKKQRQLERERVQKKRRTAFFLLLIAIVVAAVLGFASYNMTKNELDKEKQTVEETLKPENTEETVKTDTEESEETETPSKNTPKPTEVSEKAEQKNEKYYETVANSCNIYRDDRMDSIRCPYPESFEQGSKSNKNTVISLVDPLNDGAMMICAEAVGTGKSASVLMKNYAAGVGGSIKTSRAGDGWYEISFERNNKINHRKAVIADGLCVYYNFSYDVDSSEASSYEEYIEYIDYYLDKELTSATKKQNTKE